MLIKVEIQDGKRKAAVDDGSLPLRSLCAEEVDRFDSYLKRVGVDGFYGGLAKWERLAIEGYLYQKLRGHLDGQPPSSGSLPQPEREDGP